MPQVQPAEHQPVPLRCHFDMTAADAASSHEFCVFEFPGCEGCPRASHVLKALGSPEDPIKSIVWRGWFRAFPLQKVEFSRNQKGPLWPPFRELGP
jgi:hypothetical protein